MIVMRRKTNFFFIIYFIFMVCFVSERSYSFFSYNSQQYLYFTILRAFDNSFTLPYILSLLQNIFNIFHLLPLALYIMRINVLPQLFWQYCLIFRLIFDLTGHSYEKNYIAGLLQYDYLTTGLVLFLAIIPYVPSYIMCYRYAFKRDQHLNLTK
jgi:hypothetical protein